MAETHMGAGKHHAGAAMSVLTRGDVHTRPMGSEMHRRRWAEVPASNADLRAASKASSCGCVEARAQLNRKNARNAVLLSCLGVETAGLVRSRWSGRAACSEVFRCAGTGDAVCRGAMSGADGDTGPRRSMCGMAVRHATSTPVYLN